ncbi:MAG: hypothetical protein L6427_00100 [Actinomycetia bacterium]|nr:hypothetical protein [Actinomycetes bacterium]MCG2819705.1 hypothetical protein [Actinomycetes bacterium]
METEVGMPRSWGLSFGEAERIELERIIVDEDPEAAWEFLRGVIYPRVVDASQPGSCLHDVTKPVDGVERPIIKHKRIGSFD